MPNNSLYDGIIMPQGGIYQPGAPVMIPANGGGLAALKPSYDRVDASSPLQYGMLEDQFGLNNTNGGGASPFAGGTIPGPNGYTVASKDQSRLSASDPRMAFAGDEGTPATQAIGDALLANAQWAPSGSMVFPQGTAQSNNDLVYEPALVDQANGVQPGTDPWANDRFGIPAAPRPGMVTGPRITVNGGGQSGGGLSALSAGTNGQQVKLASGKSAQSGQQTKHGGVVQNDGSVKFNWGSTPGPGQKLSSWQQQAMNVDANGNWLG